jgi:hypothetical protein
MAQRQSPGHAVRGGECSYLLFLLLEAFLRWKQYKFATRNGETRVRNMAERIEASVLRRVYHPIPGTQLRVYVIRQLTRIRKVAGQVPQYNYWLPSSTDIVVRIARANGIG